jgi:hypothetical protein
LSIMTPLLHCLAQYPFSRTLFCGIERKDMPQAGHLHSLAIRRAAATGIGSVPA